MPLLAELTRNSQPIDCCTIVPRHEHVLWETQRFAHCSSRAAWPQYRQGIEQGQPCSRWRVFTDCADKLYVYLRHRDIPVNGAIVTGPVLHTCGGDETECERAFTHWAAYVRVDYEDANECLLDFAEGDPLPIECGDLVVVSGFRRHRIRGAGVLVALGIDLPHVARLDALQSESLRRHDVSDAVVFAAATALPLSNPLPPPDLLTSKLEWMHARSRRQYRDQICPTLRRFLVERSDPSSATSDEIDIIRRYGYNPANTAESQLRAGLVALSEEQCGRLRRFAEDHITSVTCDSVDDCPEYQVNVTSFLSELIGAGTVDRLLRLPEEIGAPVRIPGEPYDSIDCILRCYSPETRSHIAFHSDTCQYTVNVALSSEAECEGGELVAVNGDRLEFVPRAQGRAVVHTGRLVHGVTRLVSGIRYSLIMFFTERADSAPQPGPGDST